MTTLSTLEWAYAQHFNSKHLTRPANLAYVKVWVKFQKSIPENLVEGFQSLLDSECAKQDFLDNAGAVPGFWVLGADNFLADGARVQLFSSKNHNARLDWVEVTSAQGGPLAV